MSCIISVRTQLSTFDGRYNCRHERSKVDLAALHRDRSSIVLILIVLGLLLFVAAMFEPVTSSGWRWESAGSKFSVEVSALAHSKNSGMIGSSINNRLIEPENNGFKPPQPSRATSIVAKYSHPFRQDLALTVNGQEVENPIVEDGKLTLSRPQTSVLDLGGFLADSVDEYSPPIGELDHSGRVRYPEEDYAPKWIGIKTKVWREEDVDRYFERISAVG